MTTEIPLPPYMVDEEGNVEGKGKPAAREQQHQRDDQMETVLREDQLQEEGGKSGGGTG